MFRIVAVSLLMSGTLLAAEEKGPEKLAAPSGWGGETIQLPPRFAPDMKLKGAEHIRFAPGMMKADSDSFFSYAFVFELETEPELTDAVVEEEFLKYYRGLCTAVLNKSLPDLDPSKFTLKLQRLKLDSTGKQVADSPVQYVGTLNWIEPFATKKPQKLNLEIWTWSSGGSNYLFACVSPRARDGEIWKQLHKIRDDYRR